MSFPEYVAVVIAERERQARLDHLSQFAARVRACCNPSRLARLTARLRTFGRTPAGCAR